MKTLKIRKDRFLQWLHSLVGAYQLYAPVIQEDMVNFAEVTDVGDIHLDFQNSRLSPKSLFLPQCEQMFEYGLDPAREDACILKEASGDYPPRVVIGMRPCDARAFTLLDANFVTAEYRDPWWVRAREATTLVGLGCTRPSSTCFCTSVGGGPFDCEGLDVLLTDIGEAFLVAVLTEKGERLAETATDLEPVDEDTIRRAKAVEKQAEEKIVSKVDTSELAALDTLALYEADFWEEVGFACINCGICTYLCPTCWCFDIQDETWGLAGRRMRNWDSCMFPLFTLHASGHNPRAKKVQRVRQRFMHKLKYYVDKYQTGVACVGCGRCVQHCPVNIDIREVMRLMQTFQPLCKP